MTVAIIGSMLTGGHREAVIADAVRSADQHVDHWALIDTGTSDAALAVICPIIGEGRYTVYRYPHAEFDCATARNFGLDCAQAAGELLFPGAQRWTLILDCDERMHWNGFDPRLELPHADFDVVLVRMATEDYQKARIIRQPSKIQYIDRVHERPGGTFSFGEPDLPRVEELPKSKEELASRNLWIRKTCEEWLLDEPENTRAWLHLGNSYINTGDLEVAIPYFLRVYELSKFPEERAWAMQKASSCAIDSGDMPRGLKYALDGMRECAWYPEFPILAGMATLKMQRIADALSYANMAIVLSQLNPLPFQSPIRTGFVVLHAHWEGPWDLRAAILEAIGDQEEAQKARAMCELAMKRGKP